MWRWLDLYRSEKFKDLEVHWEIIYDFPFLITLVITKIIFLFQVFGFKLKKAHIIYCFLIWHVHLYGYTCKCPPHSSNVHCGPYMKNLLYVVWPCCTYASNVVRSEFVDTLVPQDSTYGPTGPHICTRNWSFIIFLCCTYVSTVVRFSFDDSSEHLDSTNGPRTPKNVSYFGLSLLSPYLDYTYVICVLIVVRG